MKPFPSIPLRPILRWMFILAALILPQVVQAQWKAAVGAQTTDKGTQALAFLPNEIWIHAGDSITWTFPADEIHTVTFLKVSPPPAQIRPPFPVGCPGTKPSGSSYDGTTCVNTGPVVTPHTYTVFFPTAGNFKVACLVHANMDGVVHVLPLSEELPHDQDFYDQQAADQRSVLLAEKKPNLDPQLSAQNNEVISGTGEIVATAGGSQSVSVNRFLHDETVIHAGETVEWTNEDPVTPHTITFGAEPLNPMPPSDNVNKDSDGARHAIVNAPTDKVHSGFLVAAPQERPGLVQAPPAVTRFRVTFPNEGVFPYICALHDDLGMKGRVIVLP